MSTAYKFDNPEGVYFLSFATVDWVDVFTRRIYQDIVISSLKHCIDNKGLVLHSWCLMTNHVHMIISRKGEPDFKDILRDMKKYTSGTILKAIRDSTESRKNWLQWHFKESGKRNPNNELYQFWQQDNHPEELVTNFFIDQKLNYIHQNPVEAGFVEYPEEYLLSSARDYIGRKGLLPVELLL